VCVGSLQGEHLIVEVGGKGFCRGFNIGAAKFITALMLLQNTMPW
jgi:hypothetical protein